MLQLVLDGPRTVGELAEATDLRQPTASQHLKVLRDAQLVEVEVRGNQRVYHVNFERVAAVRTFLDDFWGKKLNKLQRAAAAAARRKKSNKGSSPTRGTSSKPGRSGKGR